MHVSAALGGAASVNTTVQQNICTSPFNPFHLFIACFAAPHDIAPEVASLGAKPLFAAGGTLIVFVVLVALVVVIWKPPLGNYIRLPDTINPREVAIDGVVLPTVAMAAGNSGSGSVLATKPPHDGDVRFLTGSGRRRS